MSTRPDASHLDQWPCPRDAAELQAAIRAAPSVDPRRSLEWLSRAAGSTDGFFETVLPFIWREARKAPRMLPLIELLDAPGERTLKQGECLAILASAFFCNFAERPSDDCLSHDDLPSINFDELYGGPGQGSVEVAKLQMLFEYFERCRRRSLAGEPLARPVRVQRRRRAVSASDWQGSSVRLRAPLMMCLGRSLDDAKGMLRVDFANAIIGGAVLAYGCLQEEIMFSVCPELLVTRLFCPAMRDGEAIVVVGAEQFSSALGYAQGLTFGGPHHDPTPVRPDGLLDSHVVAIDALDLSADDPAEQFRPQAVLRELNKAFAGFDVEGAPEEIATGNWGCGAFCGDAELKSLVQLLAASRAGKRLRYFPWTNASLAAELPPLTSALVARGTTAGEVAAFLLSELRAGRVYQQLNQRFVES